MGGLSILTNVGAMAALQQLSKTQKNLNTTQLRVTTGLKVNGPKDDASTYAIAQRMRGDIAGIQSVEIALANGDSVVNTAISGGKAIADLLTEMKAKTVQANQAGLDTASRTALNNDFTSLRDQLTTIVATAEFNDTNLIKSSASNLLVLSTVDGSTITVSAQVMTSSALAISASTLLTSAGAATALTAIRRGGHDGCRQTRGSGFGVQTDRNPVRVQFEAGRHLEGGCRQLGRCRPGLRKCNLAGTADPAAAGRAGAGYRQRGSADGSRSLPVEGGGVSELGPGAARSQSLSKL